MEVPEAAVGPYLEIPVLPEDPEVVAAREGIHERIQGEMQYEDKEAEELLEAPPVWSSMLDLMMDTEGEVTRPVAATKRKRDEVAWGRRKRQREDDEIHL